MTNDNPWSTMTYEEAFEKFEEFLRRLHNCYSTAGKKNNGQICCNLLKEFPSLPWKYDSDRRAWDDRFVRIATQKRVGTCATSINQFRQLNDGINYAAPSTAGLYFVGETHFNPFTKEEFYWVKIGRANNIHERMKQYNTCNPMLFRIDYSHDYEREAYYHERLRMKSIAVCNHNLEWFLVDRNTYLEMCEKGFSYFNS